MMLLAWLLALHLQSHNALKAMFLMTSSANPVQYHFHPETANRTATMSCMAVSVWQQVHVMTTEFVFTEAGSTDISSGENRPLNASFPPVCWRKVQSTEDRDVQHVVSRPLVLGRINKVTLQLFSKMRRLRSAVCLSVCLPVCLPVRTERLFVR